MGQKIYYHNITKGWYNKNDYGDAAEYSDKGDIIKFTARGNAQVFDLETMTPEDANDYKFAKEQFLDHYKKFTGENFL